MKSQGIAHKVFIKLLFVFLLGFISCKQSLNTLSLKRIEGKQIAVEPSIEVDKALETYIEPYRDSIDVQMNEIIAYAPQRLSNNRDQDETLLGNFMADLCQKRAQEKLTAFTDRPIDFTLLNIGGLRSSIEKGDVRVLDAYEVMPFENQLVVAELDFPSTMDLIQYLANSDNPHPISKSLKVAFDDDRIEKALVNGQELDNKRTYLVLTNDYLINGGDHMDFFKKAKKVYALDYPVRNALLDELIEIDTIEVTYDQRMVRY